MAGLPLHLPSLVAGLARSPADLDRVGQNLRGDWFGLSSPTPKLRPRCGSAALASIVGQGGCGMELALRFGISRGGGLVPCRHCLRESPSFPGVFGTCLLAPCGICIPLSGPGHYRPRGVVAHCCLRARSQGLVRTRPGSGCVIRHRCSHNVAVF